MRILVNGEDREVPDQLTIGELMGHLHLQPERLAVELNHRIIRRAEWIKTKIAEGDRIEIVHFVGGGQAD